MPVKKNPRKKCPPPPPPPRAGAGARGGEEGPTSHAAPHALPPRLGRAVCLRGNRLRHNRSGKSSHGRSRQRRAFPWRETVTASRHLACTVSAIPAKRHRAASQCPGTSRPDRVLLE